MSTYYSILTNVGLAKLINAQALGTVVQWSEMAVGDGNGNSTTPVQTQTQLVRERFRAQLNQLSIDSENPNYLIAELIIPSTTGGWTVREVGVFDTEGDMVAVANFPETYKPLLSEGSAKDLIIKIAVEVSNAATVQLKIDPAVVLASRSWVETNFLRRSKVAGGTTGQVLRKTGNADEAFAWADPTSVNVTVNTVQELQTLAAAQTIVDWATITTTGAAYYVGGARLEPGDYTVNSATRITLARSYPAGTKILGSINDAQGPSVDYESKSGGGSLMNNERYRIADSSTYTLPQVSTLQPGAAIHFAWSVGSMPTIAVQGGSGEQILSANGASLNYQFTGAGFAEVIFNGTNWQLAIRQTVPAIGAKSVTLIDGSGVLEIKPEDGRYITLTGSGSANFTITGFGNKCPAGHEINILVPRTVADTGQPANVLGNYVQFAHTLSGDGLDLSINARRTNSSTLYTYQAYPNATDAEGQKCALYEQIQFVHVGAGRWRCVELPEAIQGRNGNGIYSRLPSGFGNTTVRIDSNPGGQKTYNYPYAFTDTPVPSGNYTSGSDGSVLVSFGVPNQISVSFSAIISSTGTYLSGVGACSITMVGQWKPNV